MANIIKTSVGGAGTRPVTEIVLTATNDLTYEPGAGHVLIVRNPTAASIDCVLRGADSTTVNFPGAPFISVAGGYSTPVPAGAVRAIPLDTVAAYLKGPVTVTGAGLVAVLMRAVNGRGARSIFNDPPAAVPGEVVVPTAPAAFATGDWSVATGPAPNQVVITINNLPSNGGSPITALQYSNGGTWTNLSGTSASQYALDMPAAGTEYPIRIRTRNAIGISGPGVTKTVLSGVASAAAPMIGGASIGQTGASGTIYNGYVLADGDDFDDMTAADFLTPTSAAGAYMTTRHYGIQSTAPRYLRGAASLGGYEADPWHTGFLDANRGVVPASYADMITFENGILRAKSRRATTAERALMGALNGKLNLSSMIHMGRRNMMRAPCLMEMRLRFPSELSSWNQWHPTFWLIQSQPGNGWDGLELDCEGFAPALQFNRNTWNNGVGAYGPTLGNTAPVSETEFRDYAFEILQVGGVWRVRLWENGSLVAEGSPDYGGNAFDPSRPFHLMMTNHILQSGINQAIFDAAGDAGADIECDWWRAWRPSTGTFRQPLIPAVVLETPFNTAFSFALPTPQQVWGSDVTADVIEMIPNEDNTPAQPWVRGLLPPSVTRTGNTLAGTIGDNPGQLVLARSATPALGDGCVPQPITIAVGPTIRWADQTFIEGSAVSVDLYALCDCGDLHIGKTVAVTGLAGSGLSYNASTGLLTGTPVLGSYSIAVTVTNARGQAATRNFALTVSAAGSAITTFTDTFDRPNDNLEASPSWALLSGTAGTGRVVSNRMVGSGTASVTACYLSPDMGSADHAVEFSTRSNGAGPYVMCRLTALLTGIGVRIAGNVLSVWKLVNGEFTLIADYNVTYVAGMTIRLEVIGSQFRVAVNGTRVTTTFGTETIPGTDLPSSTRQGLSLRTTAMTLEDYRTEAISAFTIA